MVKGFSDEAAGTVKDTVCLRVYSLSPLRPETTSQPPSAVIFSLTVKAPCTSSRRGLVARQLT